MHDAESFLVALGPLEVVEERPEEIAPDIIALGDGPVYLDQVASHLLAAVEVDDFAGGTEVVVKCRSAFRHVERLYAED